MATSAPRGTGVRPGRWREFWQSRALIKLRRNRLAVIGFWMSLAFVLLAIFAPFIAAPKGNCLRDLNLAQTSDVYSPLNGGFWRAIFAAPESCYQTQRDSFSPSPTPPSREAYFGTSSGYDIFYGLIWGTRVMLKLAVLIVAITFVIGLIVGGISGFYGGWVDNLIQRLIDLVFAFPSLVLVVVLITILGPSLQTIVLAFCLTGWASYAAIIRGDILRTRQLEYVDAARALGSRDWRLISKHIIPNSLTSVMTQATLDLGTIPLSIAALSFLGIGLPVGYTDWGQIMNFARQFIRGPIDAPFSWWYVTVFPATFIILFSLAWNLLGDALRDALDPRTR